MTPEMRSPGPTGAAITSPPEPAGPPLVPSGPPLVPSGPLPVPVAAVAPVRTGPRAWVVAVLAILAVPTIAAGGGAVALVAARLEDSNAATAVAGPALASTPANTGGHYRTPEEIADKLKQKGVWCGYRSTPEATLGIASGRCFVYSHDVTIIIFASDADAAAFPLAFAQINDNALDVDVLLGGNWVIDAGDPTVAGQLQALLGGAIIHIPKKPS